jgi:iron-only hydrogenase group A
MKSLIFQKQKTILFTTSKTIRRPIKIVSAAKKEDLNLYLEKQRKEKTMVVQVAPAVRVAIAEGFDLKPGQISPQKLVTGLRRLGFNFVFDTLFSADLTIVEEANEFIHKLINNEINDKPMMTSCCPGWIGLIEQNYPEMIPYISTTKSPQMIMGAVVKHIFSQTIGLEPKDINLVSIMPCVRKQGEADRVMFGNNDIRDVDKVITTQELIQLFKDNNINLPEELETDFDQPLGEGSGSATLFGKSGGVMTAALRYAYNLITNETMGEIEFTPIDENNLDIREALVTMTPHPENKFGLDSNTSISIKVAVISGLGGAKKFLKFLSDGTHKYQFVEIMACAPLGCIGGPGNPPVGKNKDILFERKAALTEFDTKTDKKAAQDNVSLKKLYDDFIGEPNGHVAHKLFHTYYEKQNKKK